MLWVKQQRPVCHYLISKLADTNFHIRARFNKLWLENPSYWLKNPSYSLQAQAGQIPNIKLIVALPSALGEIGVWAHIYAGGAYTAFLKKFGLFNGRTEWVRDCVSTARSPMRMTRKPVGQFQSMRGPGEGITSCLSYFLSRSGAHMNGKNSW